MSRYSTPSRRRSVQPPAPPPITLSLLVPIQQPIACPHDDCKGRAPGSGLGPWKGTNRHNNLRMHFVKHHAQSGPGVRLRFVCSACQHRFDCVQPANKHFNEQHGGPNCAFTSYSSTPCIQPDQIGRQCPRRTASGRPFQVPCRWMRLGLASDK